MACVGCGARKFRRAEWEREMSEAVRMETMPAEVRSALAQLVRAAKAADLVARKWASTQSVGPDQRRFMSTVDVLARDVGLVEQFVARDAGAE